MYNVFHSFYAPFPYSKPQAPPIFPLAPSQAQLSADSIKFHLTMRGISHTSRAASIIPPPRPLFLSSFRDLIEIRKQRRSFCNRQQLLYATYNNIGHLKMRFSRLVHFVSRSAPLPIFISWLCIFTAYLKSWDEVCPLHHRCGDRFESSFLFLSCRGQ